MKLLLLPCAGASATMYLRWRRALPAWLQLVPLELPGRGARFGEPFVDDFDTLVERLCDEYAGEFHGRYALLGHSMGALLAHGVARRLQAQSRPLPRWLVVSASAAPSRRDPSRFEGLQDDATLIAELRRQGGTPDEVFGNAELLRMTLDTLAADYRVCASFRPRSPSSSGLRLPMPILAWGGRADAIAPADLEAWSLETTGRFALDWFDGGHFFIRHQEPQVLAALASALRPLAPETSHAGVAAA
ncbi:alpha/beta fold hydrolase [Mitsuaria sp. GD03876]|uniref:thioesterase II family protein n=1 Tax=Mitsuaria sp. GD03876 TaxID=2975399 RepID=UPI00244AD554|nr:alpha/beta fold hydrolase [Mitsuaria sp. GD03876]MDH0864403.1 alpha/beta fold hydrolase [Mitsuaria sp. GD03876]